jgi:hypothetical protein
MKQVGIVFAVECDFYNYEPYHDGCEYHHEETIRRLQEAADIMAKCVEGKAAFLIHTSPFIRRMYDDIFYTHNDYISLWQKVVERGGEVGLHPHEEEPDGSCFYYYYGAHMEKVLTEHFHMLQRCRIKPTCQMIGYYGLNEWTIPIVERLGIRVSLNNVGEYVPWSHNDWQKAPRTPYFHSYENIYTPGSSSVLEIPLGGWGVMRADDGLVFNGNSFWYLKKVWMNMVKSGQHLLCFALLRPFKRDWSPQVVSKFVHFIRSQGVAVLTPSEAVSWWTAENEHLRGQL